MTVAFVVEHTVCQGNIQVPTQAEILTPFTPPRELSPPGGVFFETLVAAKPPTDQPPIAAIQADSPPQPSFPR